MCSKLVQFKECNHKTLFYRVRLCQDQEHAWNTVACRGMWCPHITHNLHAHAHHTPTAHHAPCCSLSAIAMDATMTDVDMASGNAGDVTEAIIACLVTPTNKDTVDIDALMRKFTLPTSDQLRRVLAACATSKDPQRVSAVVSRLAPRVEVPPFVGSVDDAAERLVVFLTAPASASVEPDPNMKGVMDVFTKSPSLGALTRVLEACKASTSIQRVSTVVTHLLPCVASLQSDWHNRFRLHRAALAKLWLELAFMVGDWGSSNAKQVCLLRAKFGDDAICSGAYRLLKFPAAIMPDFLHRLAAALCTKTADGCIDMCLVIRLVNHGLVYVKSIVDGDKRRGKLHEALQLVDLFVRCLDTALDATFAKCACVAGDGVDMATYRILVQLELAHHIAHSLCMMEFFMHHNDPRDRSNDGDSDTGALRRFGVTVCDWRSGKVTGTVSRAQIRERNVDQVLLEKLVSSGLLHRLLALTVAPFEDTHLAKLTYDARAKVMFNNDGMGGEWSLVEFATHIITMANGHGGNLFELAELQTATLRMLLAFEPLLSRECLREELASRNLVVTYAHALQLSLASGAAAQDDDSASPRDVACATPDCCDTAATGGPMQLLPCGHGLHTACARRLCKTQTALFTEPRPSSMVCRHCGASLLGPTRRVVQAWTRAWGRDLQLANPSVKRVAEARTAVHTGAGVGAGAGAPAAPPPPASSSSYCVRPTATGSFR